MKKLYFTLLVALVLITSFNVKAQTSVTSSGMSIQGIARDENNAAIANVDQLALVFTIYTLGNGNTEQAILTQTANVRTDNFGVFSYVLNIDQGFYNQISTNATYLKVTQGSVVFSNEKLQAVPYSIFAQNGVPTGAIMPFVGTTAPQGWLLCDGTAIPNTTNTLNLRTLLGSSNTPDLRAMFLRGTGSAATGQAGPALRTVQQDDLETHLHAVAINTSSNGIHNHAIARRSNPDNNSFDPGNVNVTENSAATTNRLPILGQFFTTDAGDHNHAVNGTTNSYGGTETRPISYGINYIIKI